MRIIHTIAGLNVGGANLFLRRLAAEEKKRGIDSQVIALMDLGSLGNKIQASGIPVHTLGLHRGQPSLAGLMRLKRLLNCIHPDIIHAWMYHAAFAATLAEALSGQPHVLVWNIRHTPYNLNSESFLTALLIRLCARLSSRADAIVFNAGYSLYQHEEFGYHNPRQLVIPNGFDIGKFTPLPEARKELRQTLGVAESTPLVCMIARYHPMKDHATFLKAASVLNQRRPDVQFVLIGRGVDHQNSELKHRIEALELSEPMHLLGERSDIAAILPGFDLVTLTSAWGEGFPNVIGEAMACEVPCVVTDVGDAGYVVAETGLVVEAGDEVALAESWEELLDLSTEQRYEMGKEARKRILENFTMPKVVNQYINLYETILAEISKSP